MKMASRRPYRKQITNKTRNFDTPEYKAFRKAVLKRDKYKCKYPQCNKSARQVHHIIRWADSVHLRYTVSNGISLCYDCHKKIKGKEKYFILVFAEIVRRTNENNN